MTRTAFDKRYRYWAQRSGELFTEARRYIPGGAGISARTVKPAVFNTGCVLPEPGYLELLCEQTRRHGALLIFDEPDEGRARLRDELWAAHESARLRLHPLRASGENGEPKTAH